MPDRNMDRLDDNYFCFSLDDDFEKDVCCGQPFPDGTDSDNVNDSEHRTQSLSDSFESPKFYIPQCSEELKPSLNMTFKTVEDAYEFYKKYGAAGGFDVRRHTEKKHRDGTILNKFFVCNRAGLIPAKANDKKNQNVNRVRRTVVGRCNCNAKLCLKFAGSKGYYVAAFEERHNHDLVSKEFRQFMKVNRQISDANQLLLMDAAKSGIGPSKTYTLAKHMSGGYENIGATCTDFRNFSRNMKAYIGQNDGQMVIDRFKQKKDLCSDFYYEYETDSEGHINKLFWSDLRSRREYEIFGDVVSFDATFRTNKYCMAFTPFTGVNNYKKSITFACGLISSENVEHCTWLFKAFHSCMGRQPVCIITDQCPAMKQAVPAVFTESRHRLCMWHIMNKFPTKIGASMPTLTEFMAEINKFIWNEEIDIDEFESGWKSVIDKYDLADNNWLTEMFKIRDMWIPAYFKNVPMEGLLRTTSRSEGENAYFNQFRRRWDSLCEFFLMYDTAIEMQRHNNAQMNYDACKSLPMTETPLLVEKDAAELYTRPVFYDVQSEIKDACFALLIHSMADIDGLKKYVLKEKSKKTTLFQVKHDCETGNVDCSCNKFLRTGLLCSHAFFALNQSGIQKIPRQYVINRWMKNAESRVPTLLNLENSQPQQLHSQMNELWIDFHACLSLAGTEQSSIDKIHLVIKDLKNELRGMAGRSVVTRSQHLFQQNLGPRPSDELSVLPPRESRNKGCGKRILSAAEKAINDNKKRSGRKCHFCLEMNAAHDTRTCPLRLKE